MDVSKNSGTPQMSHFNRVFHYFHHPFWDIPILETPIPSQCFFKEDSEESPILDSTLLDAFTVEPSIESFKSNIFSSTNRHHGRILSRQNSPRNWSKMWSTIDRRKIQQSTTKLVGRN